MQKNFAEWHAIKIELDARSEAPSFQEREIWWCAVGVNIGYEIFGKSEVFTRPVLVNRKFSRFTFLGVPLTSKLKDNSYSYRIHFKSEKGSALLDQVRTFDSRRLIERMGYLTDEQFEGIHYSLTNILKR